MLVFEYKPQTVASAPNRADIACFAGWVRWRGTPEPGAVTIDSWEVFDSKFAWEQRIAGDPDSGSTYMGAAVRSYFAQGGRKCYVVPVGDPWAAGTPRATRLQRLPALIPGYPNIVSASPSDRATWRGVAGILGLPDVSFLCVPDLPDLIGADLPPLDTTRTIPATPEIFVECSAPERTLVDEGIPHTAVPRADEAGYATWATALRLTGSMIARFAREVQFIAAMPIPARQSSAEKDLLRFLNTADNRLIGRTLASLEGTASAFIQFAYPWVRTTGSKRLPEGLEPPDSILAGLQARNAFRQGAYLSAGGLSLGDVSELYPELNTGDPLANRVSLIAQTPSGMRLISDVTTSRDAVYRPASVNRLVSAIVRAARRLGEDLTFESSGDSLWGRIRRRIEDVLKGLYFAGALRGASTAEAYSVRCDRSTMTQNDLDNGRVVAIIQFLPAVPIETIRVVLSLSEGGQVSLTEAA